ncbi:MAG: hypothetical protein EBY83_09035 [Verrucomicrobia bacterium]|nr:hypothetical protein [Verrucomicrobiota bacterium]
MPLAQLVQVAVLAQAVPEPYLAAQQIMLQNLPMQQQYQIVNYMTTQQMLVLIQLHQMLNWMYMEILLRQEVYLHLQPAMPLKCEHLPEQLKYTVHIKIQVVDLPLELKVV